MLLGLLHEFAADPGDGAPRAGAIVFTSRKDSVAEIVNCVAAVPGVRASRFVGQTGDGGMTQVRAAGMAPWVQHGSLHVGLARMAPERATGQAIPARSQHPTLLVSPHLRTSKRPRWPASARVT